MKFNREEEILKPSEDANTEKSNWHLRVSGETVKPTGSDLRASFAVHYYDNKFEVNSASFACQIVGDVEEIFADVALKELRKAMMKRYGRKEIKEQYEEKH